jgi:hypothetical protein
MVSMIQLPRANTDAISTPGSIEKSPSNYFTIKHNEWKFVALTTTNNKESIYWQYGPSNQSYGTAVIVMLESEYVDHFSNIQASGWSGYNVSSGSQASAHGFYDVTIGAITTWYVVFYNNKTGGSDVQMWIAADRFSLVVYAPTAASKLGGQQVPISWTYTGNSTTPSFYVNIYYVTGTTYTPIASDLSVNSGTYMWTVPTTITGNYYIYVNCTKDGHIWWDSPTFYIAGSINVTSPSFAATWTQNTTHAITYTAHGGMANVDIFLTLAPYPTPLLTIATGAANNGSCSWKVPAGQTPSTSYRIKIWDASNHSVVGYSSNFTVALPAISVTAPVASTTWAIGSTYLVTWTTTGTVANVIIALYQGSTPVATITASTPNTGSFSWTIPSTVSAGSNYKVVVDDATHHALNGTSATFTIASPSTGPSIPGYDGFVVSGIAIAGFLGIIVMALKSNKRLMSWI